jgi:NhaA family Na+:H+ antiporter
VFRHLPVADNEDAIRAADLAEYTAQTTGRFWDVHEALMERGPVLAEGNIERSAAEFDLPLSDATNEPVLAAAQARVRNDIDSAQRTGAQVARTFFIHGCAMPVRGMKAHSGSRCPCSSRA